MKNKKLITGIAITIVVAGAAIYLFRRIKKHNILTTVADAGYETAHDVHFPLKHNRPKRYRKID
jgi:hypothetical protein